MTSCEVVCCVLLATDKLLRMEKLSIGPGSNLINDSWLQVEEDCSRHMLPGTCLTEESVEGIISSSYCLITWHLTIRLYAYRK